MARGKETEGELSEVGGEQAVQALSGQQTEQVAVMRNRGQRDAVKGGGGAGGAGADWAAGKTCGCEGTRGQSGAISGKGVGCEEQEVMRRMGTERCCQRRRGHRRCRL